MGCLSNSIETMPINKRTSLAVISYLLARYLTSAQIKMSSHRCWWHRSNLSVYLFLSRTYQRSIKPRHELLLTRAPNLIILSLILAAVPHFLYQVDIRKTSLSLWTSQKELSSIRCFWSHTIDLMKSRLNKKLMVPVPNKIIIQKSFLLELAYKLGRIFSDKNQKDSN